MRSTYVIIAMLAVAFYKVYSEFYPNESCQVDPPIRLDISVGREFSWDACHVFSLEYSEARDKFRRAARKAGAQGASVPVVMDDGSDDSPLTTDIAILKGGLPGVLVLSSGTHGVEGYAGSAIQLALLQENVLPPAEKRPTVVLVHAVNPSGMKNYRRFNEHNVDLNRNSIANFEEFLRNRDPNIAGYDDFRFLTAPQRKPIPWWDGTFGFWLIALPALYQHGYLALKRVLVAGQYHHPEGIFYGGNKLEPSIHGLIELLAGEELQILVPLGTDDKLVWIDVHTGLGPFGMDTAGFENDIPSDKLEEWFPTAHHRLTPHTEDAGALDGYELSKGSLVSLVHSLTKGKALAVIQEFGTLPGVLVAQALILENMMHHYGGATEKQKFGRPWLQAAFYPQSTQWRSSIVKRGVSIALQSIDYIVIDETTKV